MQYFKKILTLVIINQIYLTSLFAAEPTIAPGGEFNLQEIALPSEVKDLSKSGGSVYYSTSVKNKVLIPVHIWGEVRQAGLHFIPSDTTFIKGLSLAGGPNSNADLEEVTLVRGGPKGTSQEIKFDLSDGVDNQAHQFNIEAGDTVFIKKDTFFENRAYYTSLISIFITVLSTFVIVQKVK